ncbi:MAG: hypothetical protein J4N76_06315, partial [Chloroflexi bacterium]|nr:hypothetical protein [Chloroflexota bacterium]
RAAAERRLYSGDKPVTTTGARSSIRGVMKPFAYHATLLSLVCVPLFGFASMTASGATLSSSSCPATRKL